MSLRSVTVAFSRQAAASVATVRDRRHEIAHVGADAAASLRSKWGVAHVAACFSTCVMRQLLRANLLCAIAFGRRPLRIIALLI